MVRQHEVERAYPRPINRRVAIISPTRNEARNLDEFTKRVTAALELYDLDWEIVLADDSDDDTPAVVDRLASEGAPISLAHREPEDRSDSVAGAVKYAVERMQGVIVIVIDGDLQHPPELLPAMLAPMVTGHADFVIGSRYAAGGSADGLGSTWRKLASRSSALVTAAIFPQYRYCSDLASGHFGFNVDDLDLSPRPSTGFKFLPEALVRCRPRIIAEVPYDFEERTDGLSKARVRDGLKLLRSMLALRMTTRDWRGVAVDRTPRQLLVTTETAPCATVDTH